MISHMDTSFRLKHILTSSYISQNPGNLSSPFASLATVRDQLGLLLCTQIDYVIHSADSTTRESPHIATASGHESVDVFVSLLVTFVFRRLPHILCHLNRRLILCLLVVNGGLSHRGPVPSMPLTSVVKTLMQARTHARMHTRTQTTTDGHTHAQAHARARTGTHRRTCTYYRLINNIFTNRRCVNYFIHLESIYSLSQAAK